MKLWMKQKAAWDEILGMALALAGLAMLGVSTYLCFCGDIWYDELFTMGLANQSCGKLISVTARDVHPPLYYMIVRLFLALFGALGKDIVFQAAVAKLVSVLPFFLCMLYGITRVRKNFGMLPAGLFCFLLPAMPRLADYTVEIRMYGWALFFVTAGMLHAYELACKEDDNFRGNSRDDFYDDSRGIGGVKKEKKNAVNWAAFTLYSLAACYTHYFACAAYAMVYLYLFLAFLKNRRLLKEAGKLLGSALFCVAGYLPWIVCALTLQLGQVKENYWIQPLTWRSLGGCLKFVFQFAFPGIFMGSLLGGLLFLLYGILFVSFLRKYFFRHREKAGTESGAEQAPFPSKGEKPLFVAGCIGVLAGTVLFGFLASLLLRPVFVYRYMLPALGLFWLAFAILFSEIKDKKVLSLSLLAVLFLVGIGNYRAFYGEEMWKRVQMEKAMDALPQIEEGDIVVYNFDQAQAVISCYLNNDTYLWYGKPETLIREMYPGNYPLVEGEFSDERGIEALKELFFSEGKSSGKEIPGSLTSGNDRIPQKRKVWFLGSGNAREEILEKWKEAGVSSKETASVMIERYWFNIYELKFIE